MKTIEDIENELMLRRRSKSLRPNEVRHNNKRIKFLESWILLILELNGRLGHEAGHGDRMRAIAHDRASEVKHGEREWADYQENRKRIRELQTLLKERI